MRRPALAGLLLALAFVTLPSAGEAQAKRRGDRFRITKDDLAEVSGTIGTAADVIRTMRPQWLSTGISRTASSNLEGNGGGATQVVLYIDDNRQPSLDQLQTVSASRIVEMRYLDQNRAIQMRGPGHEMGVIEVTTVDKRR